jgi:hypothetical protein
MLHSNTHSSFLPPSLPPSTQRVRVRKPRLHLFPGETIPFLREAGLARFLRYGSRSRGGGRG